LKTNHLATLDRSTNVSSFRVFKPFRAHGLGRKKGKGKKMGQDSSTKSAEKKLADATFRRQSVGQDSSTKSAEKSGSRFVDQVGRKTGRHFVDHGFSIG
jgi:hypothetical protein